MINETNGLCSAMQQQISDDLFGQARETLSDYLAGSD
jgi:hypothetical protein